LGLAIVDCIPVVFFSIMVSVVSLRFHSLFFFIGAFLVILAGALKCLWKFVLALSGKNVPFLFYQMRGVMPVGFLLILISLFVDRSKIVITSIMTHITTFPANICFLIGILGMVMMVVFAKKLDSTNVKHNWIEQVTNAVAQFFIMLGVIL